MLIDEICEALLPAAAERAVADVRIGLGYTAVQVDDGGCGLAYTFRDEIPSGCSVIHSAGTLVGRQASELALWAKSHEALPAAIGLATLNALIGVPAGAVETDLLALLACEPADEAGMVGHFAPLADPLKARCRALHILELRADPGSGLLPASAAAEVLPRCRIVILSATTLINRTLDELLPLCRSAREVAILGPSTPMLPEVFAGRGVTCLSGVRVSSAERALRVVSEGGGTRQFGGAVRKLTLRLPA